MVVSILDLCYMENNIKGKVIAITGASSGIGEATAIVLAAQGAKVVLGARRKDRLERIVNRIKAEGGEATYLITDIKNRDDLIQLVNLACKTYGHLDVVVNNAGIARLSRMDDLQIADWEEMIDVNIKGTLYASQQPFLFLKSRVSAISSTSYLLPVLKFRPCRAFTPALRMQFVQ